MFTRLFNKLSNNASVLKRSPDMGFWPKGNSRSNLQAQYPQAGIKFDHPVVGDPSELNSSGKMASYFW